MWPLGSAMLNSTAISEQEHESRTDDVFFGVDLLEPISRFHKGCFPQHWKWRQEQREHAARLDAMYEEMDE